MKRFSIVSTGTLKAVHGANFVLDNIVKSKPFFNDVLLNKIYSSAEVVDVNNGEEMPIGEGNETCTYKATRGIRSFFRNLLSSDYIIWARLKEYLNYVRPAKCVAKRALSDSNQCEWLIFQEIHSAYYYLKLKQKNSIEKKTAIIIHQADDLCGQFLATFPAFNNSEKQTARILRLRDYVYENIDKIIYISQKAYEESIAPISKRCMIYNGISDVAENMRSRKLERPQINLVCVGSMSGRKGQDVIISALALLPKEKKEKVKLFLVGDGSARGDLERRVLELHLNDVVEFMGLRKDVANILVDMDVFVMPSKNEGLSISTLEALRAGLFLLLTDVGGNCEVMGDDCGIVITRDPKDVARKLETIIDQKLVSQEQKERSVERFHRYFGLKNMAEGYEKMMISNG
ncbi:hypothetical protein C3V43_13630 [Bacteroides heparinolyticus]|uniref:glycosyltransferase family 4 protein n=1 Tax=Prevotella heparinolytica TaxID=28113 RepID=UPI000D037D7B|nr:glycosyltransferase family 4 protein [Bacteroides heparinolyticus]AVM58663.1 hypothetical protein C3V43_13630 [Bacteroides heparinolyticus]